MFVRLETILNKYHMLQQKLQDEEIIQDIKQYTQLSKESAQLEKTAQKYQTYLDHQKEIEEAKLLLEEQDEDVVALAHEEINENPPNSVSLDSITSIFQPFDSA